MSKLPFVVQPRRQPILEQLGTEETGILEIKRFGYLTVGEKSFVQQVQQLDGGTSQIITVSRQVARKFALGMDQAYSLVLQIISGSTPQLVDDLDPTLTTQERTALHDQNTKALKQLDLINQIEQEFAEDLTRAVREMSAGQVREKIVHACCLLKYRINTDITIDEVERVHPDLIDALDALFRDEERKCLDAFSPPDDTSNDETTSTSSFEEAEKKPAPRRATRSRTTTGD